MTLAEKIAKASTVVGGKLEPDKKNTQPGGGGYEYISADKMLAICGQALAENGVVVFPGVEEEEARLNDKKPNAKPFWEASVKMMMVVSDGESQMECLWVGRGVDYTAPDKATYKAITSGHARFIAKLLNVGMGNEDGEHENGHQEDPGSVEAPRPAKPNGNGAVMSLETAQEIQNSKGKRYGDMTTEELSNMSNYIARALNGDKAKNNHAHREELLLKQAAIGVLLQAA